MTSKTPKPSKAPPALQTLPAEPAQAAAPRSESKIAQVIAMLRAPGGATIEAIGGATGWQSHSVRGAMSGAIKKKLGLAITSEKVDGVRVYRIDAGAAA